MNILVVLLVAYFCVTINGKTIEEFDAELAAKVVEVGTKCAEELKISTEALEELTNRKIPTTHDGQCVFYCVEKHFGLMDAEGKYNREKTLEYVEEIKSYDEEVGKNLFEIVEHCEKEMKETDPCKLATEGAICTMEELKKRGIKTSFFGF